MYIHRSKHHQHPETLVLISSYELPSNLGSCRPTVPPGSPVVFDVQLLYIPGLEDEE